MIQQRWAFWLFSGLAVLSVALLLVSARFRDSRQGAAPQDLLKSVQNDIASADGASGYYARTYRLSETGYWPHIAGWITEDSIVARTEEKRPFQKIVDIGCGYGTLLAFVSSITGAEATCMDATAYLKPEIQSRYGLKFVQGDVERDPVPIENADAVIMTEVLEHFNFQPVPTLRRIRDAMRPGGRFYLSTPNVESWGRVNRYPSLAGVPSYSPSAARIDGHIWVYSREELEKVLSEAGFRVERMAMAKVEGRTHFNVTARRL